MNKEFLLDLSDRLETLYREERHIGELAGFDMRHFVDHDAVCGTVGCIAGSAVALAIERGSLNGQIDDHNILETATDLLGLSPDEAEILFYAKWNERGYWANAQEAANILRQVANGEVDLLDIPSSNP